MSRQCFHEDSHVVVHANAQLTPSQPHDTRISRPKNTHHRPRPKPQLLQAMNYLRRPVQGCDSRGLPGLQVSQQCLTSLGNIPPKFSSPPRKSNHGGLVIHLLPRETA
jgi:hypothetical protein